MRANHLTYFSGDLHERFNATFTVVSFGGQRGHVVPAHRRDYIQHGLRLVRIRRNDAGEEVVAGVVAQLRSRGCIADLRDLQRKRKRGFTVFEITETKLHEGRLHQKNTQLCLFENVCLDRKPDDIAWTQNLDFTRWVLKLVQVEIDKPLLCIGSCLHSCFWPRNDKLYSQHPQNHEILKGKPLFSVFLGVHFIS